MSDCIFCKIAEGEIPSTVVFEDDELMAFEDVNPKASVHVLIIPKEHLSTMNDPGPEHEILLGRMMLLAARIAAARIAKERGVSEGGYRVLVNCNADGGQEVFHLHMHVIGGRRLGPMA
jgi:histidine triad (HIT) family protein